MSASPYFDFSHLSPAERIQLAEDLWDSIAPNTEDLPLTEPQRAELERRLRDLDEHPDTGAPWEEIRERLHGLLKRGG